MKSENERSIYWPNDKNTLVMFLLLYIRIRQKEKYISNPASDLLSVADQLHRSDPDDLIGAIH